MTFPAEGSEIYVFSRENKLFGRFRIPMAGKRRETPGDARRRRETAGKRRETPGDADAAALSDQLG